MSNPERKRRVQRYPGTERHETAAEQPGPPEGTPPEVAAPLSPDVLATNTGVRLACTMAAMMGLFALFLCWAERESRVIRRFAVQSASLTVLHGAIIAAVLLLGMLIGSIPYLGLLMTLLSWLCYIAALMLLAVTRIRLMKHAWLGIRFNLPPHLERMLTRYY